MQALFNPEPLLNVTTKEAAYILGLLWADGFLSPATGRAKCIGIESIEDDLGELVNIFNKCGKWRSYRRTRHHWQPLLSLKAHCKVLYEYLILKGFREKKTISAASLLRDIPYSLRKYWFRGLSDGDGSFYINRIQYLYQFACVSSFDQDWSYFQELLESLDVKFKITRTERVTKAGKINRSSALRITNRESLLKFGKYIYAGFEEDRIGLQRKYRKFKEISEREVDTSHWRATS